MKREGYTNRQIAKMHNISEKTVARSLIIDTEKLCVDGTPTRKGQSFLDQYKIEIHELIEQGFKSAQIQRKMQAKYPEHIFKRTTVNGYLLRIRDEIYDVSEHPVEVIPDLPEDAKLYPYKDEIAKLLKERHTVSKIFRDIKDMGYSGSYSLLQQHCHPLKPVVSKTKKTTHSVSRKDIGKAIWSSTSIPKKGDIASTDGKNEVNDIEYIRRNFPEYTELETIIKEFRISYASKDIEAIEHWINTYSECRYQGIVSFINGIKRDSAAFYNSMKYEFNNGLLEGFVNKLKEVKRSMFGRASYTLLRAKMLLLN